MKKVKCVNCGEKYPEDEINYSDNNETVCNICFSEAEPMAIVVYSNNIGELDTEDGKSQDVITAWENPTDFKIEWKSIDAWRGYYKVVGSGDWVNIHSDCILEMSEDAKELKNFDEKLEEFCEDREITFAKVFCRSSNLFSSGYDVFVKKEHIAVVDHVVKALKEEHRDSIRFNETALTGKDTKDMTQEDKDFVLGAGLIMLGVEPEMALRRIRSD